MGGDRAPLLRSSSPGPFLILGFLIWLALRLRRRQVTTRLLEQN